MNDPSTPPSDALARSISPDDLPDPRRSLALLADAQSGNREALEELVRRYQDRLRRIVRIQFGSSSLRREFDSMDIVAHARSECLEPRELERSELERA